MAMKKNWTPLQRRLRAKWLTVVEMQAEGQKDVREFCLDKKIPISTFYKWRQILQSYDEAAFQQLSPEASAFWDSPPAFAAVNIADENDVGQDLADDRIGIEIVLPNGVQVRVASSEGIVNLAGVLKAVEGLGVGVGVGVGVGAEC